MRILAVERPISGVTAERFTPEIRAAEARVTWDMHQAGVIRELYFRADEEMAVLVLECAGRAEAEAALARLPMVATGLIEFEVWPLRAYPGFARLFAPTSEG